MNPLAGFSDWTLALLPRLFLYPGGVALIAALLLAVLVPRSDNHPASTAVLHRVLSLVAHTSIPALACAWAALALLPLPGTSSLPFPVDRFSILAIVAISLLFDLAENGEGSFDELWPSVAILLALMSVLASQRALATGAAEARVASYLAGAAVLAGLAGLFDSTGDNWSRAARWLAWWGGALALGMIPGGPWGFVGLPVALSLGWGVQRSGWSRYATLLSWLLAVAALLTSLLLPRG